MINQIQREMNEKQEAMKQDILRRRQEEQNFKDEVLRLLNEINGKLHE